jgi:hypothetical protein
MKAAARSLVKNAARRGSDWQPPARAEPAARKNAGTAATAMTGIADVATASSSAAPLTQELGGGAPLAAVQRAVFERRVGADFSRVRVHTEGPPAEAVEDLGARALTVGNDVAFAPGEFAPQRMASQQLLAHELTHVAQQTQAAAVAVQFEPKDQKAGIGAAPPEEDFIKDPDNWGAEDAHVLFKPDGIAIVDGEDALKKIVADVTEPITVHVHGYASGEGPGDYNLNLSAHRGAELKGRLEKLLPEGSKVFIFAHGESRHFGAAEANRRAGVSFLGPIDSGFRLKTRFGPPFTLGQPSALTAPTQPRTFTTKLTEVPPVFGATPPVAPFLKAPPTKSTPRELMDNAALTAPSAAHGVAASATGNVVEQWDAAYNKYRTLGIPDKVKVGPFDLGAGELGNKEVANSIKAYHERNNPTAIEKSNAEVNAHIVLSPNLLDLFGKKKKGKDDK